MSPNDSFPPNRELSTVFLPLLHFWTTHVSPIPWCSTAFPSLYLCPLWKINGINKPSPLWGKRSRGRDGSSLCLPTRSASGAPQSPFLHISAPSRTDAGSMLWGIILCLWATTKEHPSYLGRRFQTVNFYPRQTLSVPPMGSLIDRRKAQGSLSADTFPFQWSG